MVFLVHSTKEEIIWILQKHFQINKEEGIFPQFILWNWCYYNIPDKDIRNQQKQKKWKQNKKKKTL